MILDDMGSAEEFEYLETRTGYMRVPKYKPSMKKVCPECQFENSHSQACSQYSASRLNLVDCPPNCRKHMHWQSEKQEKGECCDKAHQLSEKQPDLLFECHCSCHTKEKEKTPQSELTNEPNPRFTLADSAAANKFTTNTSDWEKRFWDFVTDSATENGDKRFRLEAVTAGEMIEWIAKELQTAREEERQIPKDATWYKNTIKNQATEVRTSTLEAVMKLVEGARKTEADVIPNDSSVRGISEYSKALGFNNALDFILKELNKLTI